jgi:hypothetical protein
VRSEEIGVSLPWEPFVGTIAVAPDLEAISALSPGPFGGNMDVPDVMPGNTVYLPVFNEGALHEERHGAYRMLRLQATLTPSGDLEITGDVLPVSKSETAYP